jgi:hypothetical protein
LSPIEKQRSYRVSGIASVTAINTIATPEALAPMHAMWGRYLRKSQSLEVRHTRNG